MQIKYHCSHCRLSFNNETMCQEHEKKHAAKPPCNHVNRKYTLDNRKTGVYINVNCLDCKRKRTVCIDMLTQAQLGDLFIHMNGEALMKDGEK